MHAIKVICLVLVLISAAGWTESPQPAAARQVALLQEIFKTDVEDWPSILARNGSVVDVSFLDNCIARIQWALQNDLPSDAVRFSVVGRLASEGIGRDDYRTRFLQLEEKVVTSHFTECFDLRKP